jgi:ribosomal protein S18 acetylase RimI-like enzyme
MDFKKHHLIFSVENPVYTPKVRPPTHEEAINWLKSQGEDVTSAKGMYGKPERSIIVTNPKNVLGIHKLAEDIGQESLINSKEGKHEFRYLNGENKGLHHKGLETTIHTQPPEDLFTTIKDKHGNDRHFTHNIDFSTLYDKNGQLVNKQALGKSELRKDESNPYLNADDLLEQEEAKTKYTDEMYSSPERFIQELKNINHRINNGESPPDDIRYLLKHPKIGSGHISALIDEVKERADRHLLRPLASGAYRNMIPHMTPEHFKSMSDSDELRAQDVYRMINQPNFNRESLEHMIDNNRYPHAISYLLRDGKQRMDTHDSLLAANKLEQMITQQDMEKLHTNNADEGPTVTSYLLSNPNVPDSIINQHINDTSMWEDLAKNPNLAQRHIDHILNHSHPSQLAAHEFRQSLLEHHSDLDLDTVKKIKGEYEHMARSGTKSDKSAAKIGLNAANKAIWDKGHDVDAQLKVPLGTNKLREVRDLAENSPNKLINKKHLEQLGYNLKDLGLTNSLDGKGNISPEKVQEHIDKTPATQYGHSETTYGKQIPWYENGDYFDTPEYEQAQNDHSNTFNAEDYDVRTSDYIDRDKAMESHMENFKPEDYGVQSKPGDDDHEDNIDQARKDHEDNFDIDEWDDEDHLDHGDYENALDRARERHDEYFEFRPSDYDLKDKEEAHADALEEQRHNPDPSKVFQLNMNQDHVKKLKDAGAYETFQNIHAASKYSQHPTKHNTLGWVRYTETPEGVHIDEIQSDFGASLVKQAAKQAREAVATGQITQDEADEAVKKAGEKYSDTNLDKIKNIVFQGKHPNEILHEAFLQHMRDQGKAGTKVMHWDMIPKAKISLGENPKEIHLNGDDLASAVKHISEGKSLDSHPTVPQETMKLTQKWMKEHKVDSPAKLEEKMINGMSRTHQRNAMDQHPGDLEAQRRYLKNNVLPGVMATTNIKIATDTSNIPAHMQATYNQQPKKLGYTKTAKYGELPDQTNPELQKEPMWEQTLKKREDLFKAPLRHDSYDINAAKKRGLPDLLNNDSWKEHSTVKLPNGLHYKRLVPKNGPTKLQDSIHALYDPRDMNEPLAYMSTQHDEDYETPGKYHPHTVRISEVHPNYRGQGLGRQLYLAALVHGHGQLTSDSKMTPEAHKMWQSLSAYPGIKTHINPYPSKDTSMPTTTERDAYSKRHTAVMDQPSKLDHNTMFPKIDLNKSEDLQKSIHPLDWQRIVNEHNETVPSAITVVDADKHMAHFNRPSTKYKKAVIDSEKEHKNTDWTNPEYSTKLLHHTDAGSFMTKPYHSLIEDYASEWMEHPIKGWASLTSNSMFHSAGMGHLVEKIAPHVHKGVPVIAHEFSKARDVDVDNDKFDPKDTFKTGVMDFLMNNQDRHSGNIMLQGRDPKTGYGIPLLIDHDRNFQYFDSSWGGDPPKTPGELHNMNSGTKRTAAVHPSQINNLDKNAIKDWWINHSHGINKTMEQNLKFIKDPTVRNHIADNFKARFKHIDKHMKKDPAYLFSERNPGVDTFIPIVGKK